MFILFISLITFSNFSIVKLSLVEYPFDLCISITFIFSFSSFSFIASKSKSFSFKSICSYLIPNAFRELLFSAIPIISSSVSYGLPVILRNVSPGLNNPNKVTVSACVPDINWLLTKLSSAPSTCANTFSIVSLPISS